MRTACKCRAYPPPEQAAVPGRTFGVRLVWNRILAARRARWHTERKATSYAETDRALTELKRLPELAFLGEVSSVPLQQTLRHHDRDINAAKNIAVAAGLVETKTACGADVRHVETPPVRSAVTQELHGGDPGNPRP